MNHKKLLLTLTLCLCALLCMVVTASASEVQNTGSHSHALCEGLRDNCTDPAHSEGNHGSVTFATELRQDGNTLYIGDQVWTYEHNVGYILPAGTYYLGTDLTLDHQIRISNSREVKVTLCLNGKTITCTENYDAVIQTPTTYPVEFTLCDCRPSDSVGKITHANGIRGVGVELKNNNAVNDVAHKFIMYNGCIPVIKQPMVRVCFCIRIQLSLCMAAALPKMSVIVIRTSPVVAECMRLQTRPSPCTAVTSPRTRLTMAAE